MESKFVLAEGETLEEAKKKGLEQLGVGESDVSIEVIQEGSGGFFGFGKKNFKIKISVIEKKEPSQEKLSETASGGGSPQAGQQPPDKTPDKTDRVAKASEVAEKILSSVQSTLKNADGYLRIKKQSGGIFLVIHPPSGTGKPVTREKVDREIKRQGILKYDEQKINEALLPVNLGVPVKIADYDPEFYADRDSEISIEISKNRMEAYAIVTAPQGQGRPPEPEDIIKAARDAGIKAPVDRKAIDELLTGKKFEQKVKIAEGTPPVPGRDAYIEWNFDASGDKLKISIGEDGRVDFHKVTNINNVRAGDILGRKIPPTDGVPGSTLFDEPIRAKPGRDIKLIVGKNVRISEDGNSFIAEIDGHVRLEGQKPHVLPVFTVAGDVDLKVGDIDFIGMVVVSGNVLEGFKIKAEGNVEVKGSVQGADIESGGDVIIYGGFLGKEKARISAAGTVYSKFIENGIVEAGQDVIVEKAIMHSRVLAGRKVHVRSGKGLIVGGDITSGDEVIAVTIGSALGTRTNITVGIDPLKLERLATIEEELKQNEINLDKLSKTLTMFQSLQNSGAILTREQLELKEKTEAVIEQLQQKGRELEEEREELEAEIDKAKKGKVTALGCFYPGVTVTIRKGVYVVNDVIKVSSLGYEDGNVRIMPL